MIAVALSEHRRKHHQLLVAHLKGGELEISLALLRALLVQPPDELLESETLEPIKARFGRLKHLYQRLQTERLAGWLGHRQPGLREVVRDVVPRISASAV